MQIILGYKNAKKRPAAPAINQNVIINKILKILLKFLMSTRSVYICYTHVVTSIDRFNSRELNFNFFQFQKLSSLNIYLLFWKSGWPYINRLHSESKRFLCCHSVTKKNKFCAQKTTCGKMSDKRHPEVSILLSFLNKLENSLADFPIF